MALAVLNAGNHYIDKRCVADLWDEIRYGGPSEITTTAMEWLDTMVSWQRPEGPNPKFWATIVAGIDGALSK